ncbi:sensor histidine kinase [Streptomyces sp. NPDC048111]|uniref:sensor histidine kinase n=1 Tax=Streptomyces sp. NPDC048111 TaxID=3365500 RepID=UPI00371CFBD7
MPRHEEREPLQEAPPGAEAAAALDTRDLPAPRLARLILTVVLLGQLSVMVTNLQGAQPDPPRLVVSLGCLGLVFLIQLRHSSPRARHAPAWQRATTLAAQALLTYVPIVAFQHRWAAMAGFLAGSLLLLLPARWAWPAYGVVGVSVLIPPTLDGLSVREMVSLGQSTLLTGLVVYGLTRMAELILVLHRTRGRLAGLAVTQERLRFARDLHDLLGYSLSAITIKSELVLRLIPVRPGRALDEVAEVLTIARQSLADMRAVSHGMRRMSLEQELGAAESLLRAAGIRVRAEHRTGATEPAVDAVLAAVLREAVTNVLRHSRADSCVIEAAEEAGWVRLSVENDGVHSSYRDLSPDGGSGLDNLRDRVGALGGRLTTVHGPGPTFRLTARAPATAPTPAPAPAPAATTGPARPTAPASYAPQGAPRRGERGRGPREELPS